MTHLLRLSTTICAAAAISAGAVATTAVPASAAAPCQVSGGSSMGDTPNEWSLTVTFLAKGVTCKQATAVITTCANRDSVPGWKFSKEPSERFINRANAKRRFVVRGAGGQPRCISKAYGY